MTGAAGGGERSGYDGSGDRGVEPTALDRRTLLQLSAMSLAMPALGGDATGAATDGEAFELAWERDVSPTAEGQGAAFGLTPGPDGDEYAVVGWSDQLTPEDDADGTEDPEDDGLFARFTAGGSVERRTALPEFRYLADVVAQIRAQLRAGRNVPVETARVVDDLGLYVEADDDGLTVERTSDSS